MRLNRLKMDTIALTLSISFTLRFSAFGQRRNWNVNEDVEPVKQKKKKNQNSLVRFIPLGKERKNEKEGFLHKLEEEIFRDGEEGREAQLSFYFFQPLRLLQPTLWVFVLL